MSDLDVTDAIRKALRARYPSDGMRTSPRGVLLEEVRNATGFDATRSVDAIGFNFWPSDGLSVTGYEIKASRSDWLRELKDPEKAFAFARYCDFWWVVAGSEKVVADGELPPNWGLFILNAKGKLHPVTPAAKLSPEPMSRAMLMSIVRAACSSTWEHLVEAASSERVARAKQEAESSSRHVRMAYEDLRKLVAEFEEASGMQIGTHDSRHEVRRIGAIVRAVRGVLSAGFEGALSTVEGHARVLRGLAEQADAAAAEIRQLQDVDRRQAGAVA